MSLIADSAKAVYAPGPSSSPFQPDKAQIIGLFQVVQYVLGTAVNGLVIGNAVVYATRAALFADLARPANTLGIVYNDSTAAYNGVYVKVGASGTGSWTLTGLVLPSSIAADVAAVVASAAVSKARLDQKLLPVRELVISGTKLLIPPMYYWSTGTNQYAAPVAAAPAQSPAPVFWEVDIQGSYSLVRWYYFSRANAIAGTNPIVVVETGSSPQTDADGLVLIGYSIGGQVTTDFPIVGGVAGGSVPNQWGAGKFVDACEWVYGSSMPVAANAKLLALGFNRALANSVESTLYYGGMLPEKTKGGEYITARIYLYQPTPAEVTTAAVNLWLGGTFVQALYFSKEKQIDANVSIWLMKAIVPDGVVADRFLVGFDQAAARNWQAAGGQLNVGRKYGAYIDRADYKPVDPVSYRPLYGPNMWMISGRPLPLYLENVIGERDDGGAKLRGGFSSVRVSDAGYPQVVEGWPQVTIDPDRCGTTGQIEVRPSGMLGTVDLRYATPVNCLVATYAAVTKRILLIGDSLTNRKLVRCLDPIVRAAGITPIWLGTIPGADGTTDFYNDITGLPGEGREGFEFGDYIGKVTGKGNPVTDFSVYMSRPKVGKIGELPFLRAATGGDPANRVFNSLIFDMGYYLTGTGQADPDIVIFGLITNDFFFRDTATAAANVADGIRVAFSQTRARLPSAKIGWWAPTYAVSNAGGRFGDHYTVKKAGVEAVRALADANAHVIPVWAHQSSQIGYQLDPSAFVDVNYALRAGIADSTHFNIGNAALRQQAAEPLAAFIANA